jgi:predicted RNA-binding protein YlxR (DUF448 family)
MGCGGREEQQNLLRLVCDAAGNLAVVRGHQHSGRSGYLHPQRQCCARFAARKGPLRSLRRNVDRALRVRFIEGLDLPEPGARRG